MHPFLLAPSFKPLAYLGVGISVLGAIGSDATVSWAAALVASAAIFIPSAIDWYRKARQARREEDAADTRADTDILAAEVVRRVQLEAEVRENRHKISDMETDVRNGRHKIQDLEQTIVFMKANHEALKLGVGKLDSKVSVLATPDPDDRTSDAIEPPKRDKANP